MSKIFFCADLHFSHTNIIKYSNRPFSTVEEMDQTLIKNWNRKISPKDHVYLLGDVAFTSIEKTLQYLSQMNGIKYLVSGNHDKRNLKYKEFRDQFVWVKDLAEITIDNQMIVLCHYAMRVWNKRHHGSWMLFGHSHHSLPDDPFSKTIDVGVDGKEYNYSPLSFDDVKLIMSKKTSRPVDHHRGDL